MREIGKRPFPYHPDPDHLKAVRSAALARDEGCRVCSDTEGLEVHHRTYERFGREALADLTVLCHDCHDFISGVQDRRFAPAVPEVDGATGAMSPVQLRDWLEKCGFTLAEAARRLGKTSRILSMYLAGRAVPLETALACVAIRLGFVGYPDPWPDIGPPPAADITPRSAARRRRAPATR
jgi:hypothetical protein